MQALVVYYSRTGCTRKVANELSKELGCDIEEIADNEDRSGPMGFLKSGRQAKSKEIIEIQPVRKDPSQYDMVIIGTPVWAMFMSSPVRAYIHENKDRLKKVAFFITLGNIGAEQALKDLSEFCGKEAVATLTVTTRDLSKGYYMDNLKKFTENIKE